MLLAAVLVIGSQYIDALRVCGPPSGNQTATEICRPFPVEATIPLLLLALALMWKDLAEFSLFGVGRVVRRIDAGQERLRTGQENLERQVVNLQSQSQAMNLFVGMRDEETVRRAIERTPEAMTASAAAHHDVEAMRAEFEKAWEELQPWSDIAKRFRDPEFIQTVEKAETEASWESLEGLLPADRELLDAAGLQPGFSVPMMRSWAAASQDGLELVRRTKAKLLDLDERGIERAVIVARDLLGQLDEAGLRKAS